MANRLLTALSLGICLLFITAQTQSAFAQTRKQNSGYVQIIRTLIITKNSNTQYIPKATPTIFVLPTQAPTNIHTPAASESSKLTSMPTKKVTKPTPTEKPKQEETTKILPTFTPAAVATKTSDTMTFIMAEINKYRAAQGLSPVQTSNETCSFAATRATEIGANFSHDGFQSRINNKTLPYKSWSGITENIAMTSNYTDVVTMWINSPGHAANMRADTPFVCVRQNGKYFAYVGMKP